MGEAGKQDEVGVWFLFLCNSYVNKVPKNGSRRSDGEKPNQCLAEEVLADARHAAAVRAHNSLC